jgi:hypothetical protein
VEEKPPFFFVAKNPCRFEAQGTAKPLAFFGSNYPDQKLKFSGSSPMAYFTRISILLVNSGNPQFMLDRTTENQWIYTI